MLDSIITSNRKALYVAEIGLNHNGDLATARDMIAAAARAGADAVKFQIFTPERMNSRYTSDLLETGKERKPDGSLIEFFKRFVFNPSQYRELASVAADEGVVFFASVFDEGSLAIMEDLNAPLYKLASSEVTNIPLIEAVAKTGKPAVLSTGMAAEDEIAMAVDRFRRTNRSELILLHCVSLYPTRADQMNLARIRSLESRFGLPVGFSDHSREALAPILAAVLGARLFEKHFTIDRFHECPDKEVSCTPEEFARVIDSVESAVEMAGSGAISYGRDEAATARAARRSLFARRPIPRGSVIGNDDVVALRPGVGIPANELDRIVGKKSKVDIPGEYLIRLEYLEGE
jgi:N,N'-diacetyllegionaminate synthase